MQYSSVIRMFCLFNNVASFKLLSNVYRWYENMQTKSYLFPTNAGMELFVHEYLAESKLCFQLPVQLLR